MADGPKRYINLKQNKGKIHSIKHPHRQNGYQPETKQK